MDLSKLSMSELQTLQKQLETQLKSNPAKEMAIAEAMKAEPMQPPARMMRRLREAVAQIPRSENAPGTGKSRTMIEMLNKMTPEARADVIARPDAMRNIEASISKNAPGAGKSGVVKAAAEAFPGEAKMIMGLDAGLQAIRDQAGKYDYDTFAKPAPMETPYGKSLLSYNAEGKIAGKTGAALRGLGKLASRVASPIGAALTAIDLGQALGEVQDKGAAKIAEDYKKERERKALAESEDMGDKVIEKMNPIQSNSKQYSPEERVKLKDMLSKYRAEPTLR